MIGQYQKDKSGNIALEIVYPFDVATADMIFPFPKGFSSATLARTLLAHSAGGCRRNGSSVTAAPEAPTAMEILFGAVRGCFWGW